jgi:hypothetical protein
VAERVGIIDNMAEPNDALVELKQREGEGYDPPVPARFTEAPPEPAPPPVEIPPPDWRAEERQRAEREREAASPSPPEPAESLESRPVPKRAKPKATPNLDKVRAMLDKGAP